MKKATVLAAFFLFSVSAFSQAKKDTIPQKPMEEKQLKDSTAKPDMNPKLSLTFRASQWDYIFWLIRHNNQLSAAETEDALEFVRRNFVIHP